MKLDKDIEPLPAGSKLRVRPRSSLGLKYIELEPGREGGETLAAGSTIGVGDVRPTVELDEFFNMFDGKTRVGQRNSLDGYGGGLAGRGEDLNTAIDAFGPLLRDLEPVARNLSDPQTRFGRFFKELGDAADEAAPVAEEQASLFVNLDISFTALSSIARPFLQETISEGPPSEELAIHDFPLQRPFIRNQTALFRELRPGVAVLPHGAPILADAFEAGTEVLPKTIQMNEDLADVFEALADFSDDPVVRQGIQQLTRLSSSLRPTLHFLTPAQTVCNYGTLWFRNAASLLSDGDSNGTWQRFMVVAAPTLRSSNVFGPNNEGFPSSGVANGPQVENHLHLNQYPNTAAPGQERECEAGNERFARGQTQIGHSPGNQGTETDGQE
jgi:ABC-type transporter Mla subunit MlaD